MLIHCLTLWAGAGVMPMPHKGIDRAPPAAADWAELDQLQV